MGVLTDTFNQMLDTVEKEELTYIKREERLKLALWGSNEGLWDWNITTGELFLDDRVLNNLGYKRAEVKKT